MFSNVFSSLTLIFAEEPPMQIDGSRWAEKPVHEWCQEETAHWLMSIAAYIGQPYSCIQQSLAMPGKDLLCLSRENFMACDPLYGAQLYDLLHSQQISTISSISTSEFFFFAFYYHCYEELQKN